MRAGKTKTWSVHRPDEGIGCGFTEAVAVLSHHMVIKEARSPTTTRTCRPHGANPRCPRTPGLYEDAVIDSPIFEENSVENFKGIDIMRPAQLRPVLAVRRTCTREGQSVEETALTDAGGEPELALTRPLTADPGGIMAAPQDLRVIGERIERLLDELRAASDPVAIAKAEDLLRIVTELYAAGLARVVELVSDAPDVFAALVDDELVASLLLVHGLHPDSLGARRGRPQSVRPFLAQHGGDVELPTSTDAGAVSCACSGAVMGCPSSAVTLQHAVERAIVEAARRSSRSRSTRRPGPCRA